MSEKSKRGFASMSPEVQKRIASAGGKAAHAKGKAHTFTREEAKAAGRKGGKANLGRHRFTSDEAKEAGKLGGLARGQTFKKKAKRGL